MVSTELMMLNGAIFLGVVQLLLATHLATLQRGVKWNLSMRDKPVEPLSGAAGRFDRAFKNFMETFPLFVAAVLVAHSSQLGNAITAAGAVTYLIARVLYLAAYGWGIVGLRSILWVISMIGIVMVASVLLI